MNIQLTEFLTIALAHILAVSSPGPDFAIVVRHSLVSGRKTGLWVSLGVALGILVHVSYCLLGIGLLLAQSILLFSIVKFIGAAYLTFLGIKALRNSANNVDSSASAKVLPAPCAKSAAWSGFLTNVLNPKATLFFLALFSIAISPTTSMAVQVFYGLWMCLATFVWFSFVTLVLSHHHVRARFLRCSQVIDRVMGVAFIALGLRLAFVKIDR